MFWSILVTLQSPEDDPGATSVSHLLQWHEKPQTFSSNSRRPYKHQREPFERIGTDMHFRGTGETRDLNASEPCEDKRIDGMNVSVAVCLYRRFSLGTYS